MIGLNKKDASFLMNGILGKGPTLVSSVPMIGRQGNGNFTGFARQTYSDGWVSNVKFIENAASKAEVIAAWERGK